jgi:hypothetical protein
MIKITSRQRVLSTICPGCVFFYKTTNVGYITEVPHYYIVVNRDPLVDSVIYLCWISHEVGKIKKMRSPKFFSGTLIEISPSEYNILNVPSIIDCNRIERRSIEEIINKHEKGMLQFKQNLPNGFIERIWDAIQLSPVVINEAKDSLIPRN